VRNLVIAFLVLFLPLQWGTTVLAAYCQHEESSAVTQHIGHHAHHHKHQGSILKADKGQQGKAWDASCSADHDHNHFSHAIVHDARPARSLAPAVDESPYRAFVSDAPRDNLLRPPQVTLA
jgi:hypothetical protein